MGLHLHFDRIRASLKSEVQHCFHYLAQEWNKNCQSFPCLAKKDLFSSDTCIQVTKPSQRCVGEVHGPREDFVAAAMALALCAKYSANILCVYEMDKMHMFIKVWTPTIA